MAIGFSRALATAFSTGVSVLGEAAVEEDKSREEWTKLTLAQQLKNIETAKAEAKKQQEIIDAENQAVEALKGESVPLKDGSKTTITEAMARKAIRRYGAKETQAMILQGQLAFSGDTKAKVTAAEAKKSGALDMQTVKALDTKDTGGGIFGSRFDAVAENTADMLRAMGVDPAGVDIPQLAKVEGDVQIFAGPALAKESQEVLYTTSPSMEVVYKRTRTLPAGEKTVTYENQLGNDVTAKFKALQPDMVAKDRDVLFPGIEMGLAFEMQPDGSVKQAKTAVGFDKYGIAYTRDEKGAFTQKVTDKDLLVLTSKQVEALGGAEGIKENFDDLSTEARKEYVKLLEQLEGYESLRATMGENLQLLDTHGNALTADIGSISELAEYMATNLGVAIDFAGDVLDLDVAGVREAFEGAYQAATRDLADAQAQLAQTRDPTDRLAIARRIYNANQVVLTYNYAKATGDTRISNQDFDQFFKTVSAGSAEAQRGIYKSRMNQAIVKIESKYKNVSDLGVSQEIIQAITPERQVSYIRSDFETMFGGGPVKSQKEIAEPILKSIEATKNISVVAFKINPETGEEDPNGITAYVAVRGKDKEFVRYEDGTPVVFPYDENDPDFKAPEYVERVLIPRMYQENKLNIR